MERQILELEGGRSEIDMTGKEDRSVVEERG